MRLLLGLLLSIAFIACQNSSAPLPKPHQYPRVDFPAREYILFSDSECSLTFDFPTYAVIEAKTSYFGEAPLHPCWFDVYYKEFNGRLHCSYFELTSREVLDDLIGDAFDLVSKHHSKASFARESVIDNNDVDGLLFDIQGPVASPLLFYVTDSTQHFFMGSLYFNNKVNPDSMQIIHDFVRDDVLHLIETFEWR